MIDKMQVIFEYTYRDAANYSSNGVLLLIGQRGTREVEAIEQRLEEGEFFIAEQVDIPPLYERLWRYSNGPNVDDHVWHTYRRIRPARREDVEDLPIYGTLREMATRFGSVSRWDLSLSPHWGIQFT